MPRYIPSVFLISTIFILFNTAYSQSSVDIYNKAKSLYENGNYTNAIQNLKSLEQSIGSNPRIVSLLVYSYVANKDFVNAKISIEKYKKLAVYAKGNAHQKLLEQENVINNSLKKLEEQFKNNEMTPQKKMQAAHTAIQLTYSATNQIRTQKEAENIRNYFETNGLLEKKYNEYLQLITNVAEAELKKKVNTFSKEQIYFNEISLTSIRAGNLTWTKENLKMTYFRDGTPIVMAKNEEEWINYFHAEIPCWRYHKYDPNQDQRLGLEYNMYALMSEKQIAPVGWRVPTINDWKNLTATIGDWNELYIPDAVFTLATKDGSKQYGAVFWDSYHRKHEDRVIKLKGKNKSGFSAIPNRSIWYEQIHKVKNDNNKAAWWALTPKKDWFKIQYKLYDNQLEVRKDYDTEVASFYFTSRYNDRAVLSTKNTIFVYWNFLKEDELAKIQNIKPRYNDNILTYDITRFNIQGQIQRPETYEKRSSDHMQGYPIRLVQ